MKQEEIIKYNKRCAEFLNYEFDDLSETYETPHLKLVEPQAFGDEQFSCKLKDFELDFHSDWNLIMEVIEAIEKLDVNKNVFSSHPFYQGFNLETQIYYAHLQFGEDLHFNGESANSKKEAVVEAINQFLIWYKENK